MTGRPCSRDKQPSNVCVPCSDAGSVLKVVKHNIDNSSLCNSDDLQSMFVIANDLMYTRYYTWYKLSSDGLVSYLSIVLKY